MLALGHSRDRRAGAIPGFRLSVAAAPRLATALIVAASLSFAAVAPALAQAPTNPAGAQAFAHGMGPLPNPPTHPRMPGSVVAADGQTIAYYANTGMLSLSAGGASSDIFYVAYTADLPADAAPDAPKRPLTFLFNGGPGASSAYLAIGGLGPKVLAVSARGELAEPAVLVDNPDTFLALSDLVFVDPPGTGFSRSSTPTDEAKFWGVRQDSEAMASFISQYLASIGRRDAPVFLVGESYGGFRVTLLARLLQARHNLRVKGLTLISPALELSFLHAPFYDPMAWALRLPSFAAVNLEWHGTTGQAALAAALDPIEKYALTDYLLALAGSMADAGTALAPRIAEITGLPETTVRARFSRISPTVFAKDFARGQREVLSLYDGAIAAPDPYPQNRWRTGPDPVLDLTASEFSATMVGYLCGELRYCVGYSYRLLNRDVGRGWDYGTTPTRQGFAGAIDDLQSAREDNPDLEVLIAHGYTDLVTPYLTARFLVSQLPPLPRAEPIALATYAGGHMMYMRPESRAALLGDVRAMVDRALTPRAPEPDDAEAAAPAVPIP